MHRQAHAYHYKLSYVATYLKNKLTCINTHTYMHKKHAQLSYCLLYTWYKSHALPKKVQNSDNRVLQCQYTSGNDHDTATWTREPIEKLKPSISSNCIGHDGKATIVLLLSLQYVCGVPFLKGLQASAVQ